MATIRRRPLGSWFGVVLRDRDFSYGTLAVKGALGGSARFPRPELPPTCVCCDAATRASVPFDVDTDRITADPIDVPACAACADHLERSTSGAQIAAIILCMALGAGLLGLTKGIVLLAVGAGLVLAMVAGWMARKRAARRVWARKGHHVGLEIMVCPGQTAVRTTNPRVAADLAHAHAGVLHRATLLAGSAADLPTARAHERPADRGR